ncbi:DNA polymerase III subunit chi [Pseudoduganella sp. SL102]|uniref:DNA polymerase III subunit chi n=1 Tax=Pseudoduganella albidiflava TaxID=321983 RepID=A0A411WTE3_9BURK|nr:MULTISPECIES: DNA polymerase III subunit chi [Pseudoduganella]QBI00065.1 DNA polymerase III subunit chi [Pseudoduganella albidiflava]WBS01906.1 DNA polymerase III subunit chi [Pseudoduganella sp. SL102]GGY63730.1 DNA polymerase III subunit chi [Pseudoduganella albidiflava]
MTRIDFHTNVPDKIAYACRLVRKACNAASASGAKSRIVIMTEDSAQLARLDAALWSFSDVDFLPHVHVNDPLAPDTPIVLADSDSVELPQADLLVNLARRAPAQFESFPRLIEVVSADEDDAAAGRIRFVAYKRQDFTPAHLSVGKA